MKVLHLSDLHLGKRVNEFSMIEDQKYIINQIIEIMKDEKIEAVIIAGDIYDKSTPSAEAVELFDEFLTKIKRINVKALIISGNHDSPERIAFGGNIMKDSGIYLSKVYDGNTVKVELEDEYGKINFYLLPFIKPANIRRYFPDKNIESYTSAVKIAVENMNINKNQRNILLTHQFVTGSTRSDSETFSVGGTDNVDSEVFSDFDYTALGHLHISQNIGKNIRYCGSPLKYSFSEAKREKTVTILNFMEKGNVEIKEIPLKPEHDMKEIKGTYDEITAKSFYETNDLQNCYLHISLTDEEEIPGAAPKLKAIYPYLMKLDYKNKRSLEYTGEVSYETKQKTPLELFEELYKIQNNNEMNDEQRNFIEKLIESVWEVE